MKRITFMTMIVWILRVPDVISSRTTLCDTIVFESNNYELRGYFFSSKHKTISPTVQFLQGLPGEIGDELELGKLLCNALFLIKSEPSIPLYLRQLKKS